MMEFKDVQTLKDYLNKEHQGSRIKFATKVFHVLNFTKEHPDSINCCGAAWCSNGLHFICNATIMANFLNLRSNSINTNFRDHGFRIDHSNLSQIKHEFPHLVNIRNWKMRSNNMFAFKLGLNVEDIEKIPCTSARSSFIDSDKAITYSIPNVGSSGSISMPNSQDSAQSSSAPTSFSMPLVSYRASSTMIPMTSTSNKIGQKTISSDFLSTFDLPNFLYSIIQGDPLVLMHTSILYKKMDCPNKQSLLEQITQDWIDHFGRYKTAPISSFYNIISTHIGDTKDIPQLTKNAHYLLHKLNYENVPNEKILITFDEFMNFVLHYGFCESWVEILIQLSAQIQPLSPSPSSSPLEESESASNFIPTNFHSWFQPWFNRESALRILSGNELIGRDVWFISPSETPMLFNLFCKFQDDISVTDIIFNPADNERKFSVLFNDTMATAPNWGTLLYTILKLDSNQRLESSSISRHLINLDGNALITKFNQKRENEKRKLNLTIRQSSVDQNLFSQYLPVPISRRIMTVGQ